MLRESALIRIIVAGLIGGAMMLWLLSGQFSPNGPAETRDIDVSSDLPNEDDVADKLPLVRAAYSEADMHVVYLGVRGQTRANRIVEVKAEISGKVEAVPGEKGARVKAGDILCKIAVDARRDELSQAKAELESVKLEYDGALDLQGRGLQSAIVVARAKAAVESARADTRRAELALQKTRIEAPFDGIVASQPIEVGDFLTAGDTCVTVMEIDPILVTGEVAERNVGQIRTGEEVRIELITGEKLIGTLNFIGRSPDSDTRTYPIEVVVDSPGNDIRAGLTASMRVPTREVLAHQISPASLVLNDEGTIGVRTVDDENLVHFNVVEVVSEGPGGVWVEGLPEKTNIITVGQEDVFDGQVVRVDLSPLGSAVSVNQ